MVACKNAPPLTVHKIFSSLRCGVWFLCCASLLAYLAAALWWPWLAWALLNRDRLSSHSLATN